MSPHREQRAEAPGYALVEMPSALPRAYDVQGSGPSLDELSTKLEGLQADIAGAHAELVEVEQQARAAVEREDAERVSVTWEHKHRLLNELAKLQREQTQVQREVRTLIAASLARLQEERAQLEHRQAEQGATWDNLLSSAERLLQELRQAGALREELNGRERALRQEMETLASRELIVLDDASGDAGAARPQPVRTSARPVATRREPERPAARKWAVYDPDAGKLVNSLAELLRLLARWYPNLHSDDERIREFLTLPNAEPLPDTLRNELMAAGYLLDQPATEDA
jgi:hypothetical protein